MSARSRTLRHDRDVAQQKVARGKGDSLFWLGSDFGPVRVDTLHEIAVNKVYTLVSRCELKDVVDLYFLAKRGVDIPILFPDARKKEGALDPAMISFLLAQLRTDSVPDYLIAPLDLDDLRKFVLDFANG